MSRFVTFFPTSPADLSLAEKSDFPSYVLAKLAPFIRAANSLRWPVAAACLLAVQRAVFNRGRVIALAESVPTISGILLYTQL
jgi:hypothetical protein